MCRPTNMRGTYARAVDRASCMWAVWLMCGVPSRRLQMRRRVRYRAGPGRRTRQWRAAPSCTTSSRRVHVAIASGRPTGSIPRLPLSGMAEAAADVGRARGGAYDRARAGLDGRGLAPDAVGCDRARGRGPGCHPPVVPSRNPTLCKRIELSGARTPRGLRRRASQQLQEERRLLRDSVLFRSALTHS